MSERNPYAISFGRIPRQFISRDLLIGEIIDTLYSRTQLIAVFEKAYVLELRLRVWLIGNENR